MSIHERNRTYVEVVVAQLQHFIGKDAPRSKAAMALRLWQYRGGLQVADVDLTPLVLDHFDADPLPQPGRDFLSPARSARPTWGGA